MNRKFIDIDGNIYATACRYYIEGSCSLKILANFQAHITRHEKPIECDHVYICDKDQIKYSLKSEILIQEVDGILSEMIDL